MSTSEAERLKAEGNSLFVKNDFSGAYKKYSEALKHDQKNAILYCNRAACSLGLNRYLDACTDATKATELNPGYAKAWARLAAAYMGLNRPDKVVNSWKRALGALPKENPTPAERTQRENYTRELATAQAKLDDLLANPRAPKGGMTMSDQNQLPWYRALAMTPALRDQKKWNSSAWVIVRAYGEWEEGVQAMKDSKQVRTSQGAALLGRQGVIERLTNALLSDERVFHISDSKFIDMYNKQIIFEAVQSRAWVESGVREIMEAAPKRLAEEGWDSVRYALSLTVRGWIMRAFMEDRLKNDTDAALQFLTSALELLRWGAEYWKEVPENDKGAIFQTSFIRGVKCMHLNIFMKACQKNPGPNSKYSLEELLAGSKSVIDELADAPDEPDIETDDVAFFLSFTRYPLGIAHSIQGFYHNEKARLLSQAAGGALTDEVGDQFCLSSAAYAKASLYYPNDDESHVWFMHCALQAQFQAAATVEFMLFMLDSIHRTIPITKQIWEFSANGQSGQHAILAQDMELRDKIRGMVHRGELQTDTILSKTGHNSFAVLSA